MNAENNNKTEAIKNSLKEFLNQLERKKDMIGSSKSYIYIDQQITPYVPRDKFELLDIATSLLKSLIEQFNSIDDLYLIQKLRQAELFFLNNKNFRNFTFPNFSLQIDPITLIHADIKVELKNLDKKAQELFKRGHETAATQVKNVVSVVDKLIECHFKNGKNNDSKSINYTLAVIDLARPVLEQHRGCKKILGNLFLLILTLGTAHFANKMVNNHFLFFRETDSSKKLNKLEHTVSKLLI